MNALAGTQGAIALLLLLLGTACASVPYEYSNQPETERTLKLAPGEDQFERGRPHRFLDGIGHYVISLPSKLLLLNWHVDKHDISPATEAAMRDYLHANGMENVKVRLKA